MTFENRSLSCANSSTCNTNSTTNETTVDYVSIVSNWLLIPLSVCGTSLNLLAILAFLSDRKLWTPFNYYLCHLAFCDLILSCLDTVFYFINNLTGTWSLDRSTCHFWLYIDWVVTIAIAYSLMLISFDRLWAISYPVAYRTYHSRKMSAGCILAVWIVINSFILPGFIEERQNPIDGTDMCYQDLASYKTWTLASQLLGYYAPHLCVIGSNVTIGVKLRQKLKVTSGKGVVPVPGGSLTGVSVVSTATGHTSHCQKVLGPLQPPLQSTTISDAHDSAGKVLSPYEETTLNGYVGNISKRDLRPVIRGRSRQTASDMKPLRLLAALVLCFTICWTPSYVYYTLTTWMPNYMNTQFAAVSQLVAFMNCVGNPILYHIGSNEFRKAIQRLFHRGCCRSRAFKGVRPI